MVVTAGFYLAYVTEQKVYERIVVGHVDYPPYLSIASIDLMGRLLNRMLIPYLCLPMSSRSLVFPP